jgi:hypothetical protein
LVLLFFIVRLNRQDIELRKGRAAEARQGKAEEIGRHLAERLERAERTLLQELADEPADIRTIYKTLPHLIFTGSISDGELLMPWEEAEAQRRLSDGGQSPQLILQAQQA